MTKSIDQLRRDAKALRADHAAGDAGALARIRAVAPRAPGTPLTHADYLHVIAREHRFASWPHLKLSVETHGMDRAARQQRLGIGIKNGQNWVVETLLAEEPGLAASTLGLACCFYLRDDVARFLAQDPGAATRAAPLAPPLISLAQSHAIHLFPEREGDMIAIAEMLLEAGADVNAGLPAYVGADHMLSTLYFALGHAGNLPLARWLLDHGADPNDGESLYHATELGHTEGLRLLLEHGANPDGTNALLRAMDFHSLDMVRLLLAHGADADAFNAEDVGGEAPWVYPALHQAARRMNGPEMARLLLDHGADPHRLHDGVTAYSMARVVGNRPLSRLLEAEGAAPPLSPVDEMLARAADDDVPSGARIDPATLPPAYRDLIRMILHLPSPDMVGHLSRLVDLGLPHDQPDAQGLTPLQIAGWEGLPDIMAYLLTLNPDLDHINGYGGTLLSTILHGSENNPDRKGRDYVACLTLALQAGVPLPRRAQDAAGCSDIAEFLRDWAAAHPEQVIEAGPL